MHSFIEYVSAHSLTILDITGTILGLWYLWLEYRAKASLWIVGILMPALYIFTYYKAGLYADFWLQIYYLLAAVYGWCSWKWGYKREKQELPITHASKREVALSIGFTMILWAVLYLILEHFTDSNVPVCDGFINALSVVGLWMLARKYVEQWIVWLIVDAFSCVLYVYKGIPFTAGLYGFYTVIAVFGYLKWLKMMRAHE